VAEHVRVSAGNLGADKNRRKGALNALNQAPHAGVTTRKEPP
jgi:hypothetical protein